MRALRVRRTNRRRQLVVVAVLVAATAWACRQRAQPSATTTAAAPTPDDAATERAHPVAAQWVTVFDPLRAFNGYTLTLHELRIPVLLDMNGRPVHGWPEARIKSRVRLLRDGSILGIGLGRQVVEYDWEGHKTWEFRTPDAIPHHDVLRLENGNTLVLVLRQGEGGDTLLEVDRAGKVVWTWRAVEHLGARLPKKPPHPEDLTHINSLQELPQNPLYAGGDRRFKPGNLLLSARNLNAVFVIDRRSGDLVWWYDEGLDRQHEAAMSATGQPAAGTIQIFNNRPGSFGDDRQSELLEIDPRHGTVLWRYRAPGFFTPTGGLQQRLANGNLLVTSTRGGRVFEITRAGDLVWEWVPPYEPVRAVRLAADACPQLARLAAATTQRERAVVPAAGYRYVDPDAYRFARRADRGFARLNGEERPVLRDPNRCADVTLPRRARIALGYGVDREQLRLPANAGRKPLFTLRLRPAGALADRELLHDAVGLEGPAWRETTVALDAYALQTVRLCVGIDDLAGTGGQGGIGSGGARFAYWEQPDITTPERGAVAGEETLDPALNDLTPEEREVRLQHLRSLGYIN